MKIYIAARYGRKEEARTISEILQEYGHTVTSTWMYQVEDEMLREQGPNVPAQFAAKDLDEIRAADMLLALSEEESNSYGRGGRHVEFGYAMALEKVMCIIGPLENLFHYHYDVSCYDSFDHFLEDYREGYDGSHTGTSGGDSQERPSGRVGPRDFRLQPVEMSNPRDNTVW